MFFSYFFFFLLFFPLKIDASMVNISVVEGNSKNKMFGLLFSYFFYWYCRVRYLACSICISFIIYAHGAYFCVCCLLSLLLLLLLVFFSYKYFGTIWNSQIILIVYFLLLFPFSISNCLDSRTLPTHPKVSVNVMHVFKQFHHQKYIQWDNSWELKQLNMKNGRKIYIIYKFEMKSSPHTHTYHSKYFWNNKSINNKYE